MAAVNENVPMVVDGEVDEEDYIVDAAAEALNTMQLTFLPLPKWQLLILSLLRTVTSVCRRHPAL